MCEYCGTGISYQNSSSNYQSSNQSAEGRPQRRTSCTGGCNPCTGCRG